SAMAEAYVLGRKGIDGEIDRVATPGEAPVEAATETVLARQCPLGALRLDRIVDDPRRRRDGRTERSSARARRSDQDGGIAPDPADLRRRALRANVDRSAVPREPHRRRHRGAAAAVAHEQRVA